MVIFLDTSSLIKRYINEDGTEKIDEFYCDDNLIIISPITPIEFMSALKRKLIEKTILQETYELAINQWSIEKNYYDIVNFNDELVSKSIEIIEKEQIKTLDSIQLSSALLVSLDEFVTSDNRLFKVAMKYLSCKVTYV